MMVMILCLHANIASFLQPLVFLKRMNICLLFQPPFQMNGITFCPFSRLSKWEIQFLFMRLSNPPPQPCFKMSMHPL